MGNKANDLINLGLSPEKATALESIATLSQQLVAGSSIGTAISAAGSTLGTATVLTALANRVSTVGASQGVRLPSNVEVGGKIIVSNAQGTNALAVYPVSASETINGASAGTAYSLAVNTGATFLRVSSTQWITC